ncbi:hypothetical protein ACHAWF_012991 [Thalassiosira exigua]
MVNGMIYPAKTGRIVEDLSPDVTDVEKKSLYVIVLDSNSCYGETPRPYITKIYGAYWSADGPAPVNKIAVGLWSKFGVGTKIKPTPRDYEDLSNIDGRHTKTGECYSGFMSIPLSITVDKVDDDGWMARLHRINLLEKCLKLVGISVGGSSIPIKVGKNFLKGKVFKLAGEFVEIHQNNDKANNLVTKMLEMAGATVNVRMTKKTNYLLAGKDAHYTVHQADKKFPHIKVVSLKTVHKLLLGSITLKDLANIPSLSKESCMGEKYQKATTIPKKTSSDLEEAIDELGVWLSWRDRRKLEPLYKIIGYPRIMIRSSRWERTRWQQGRRKSRRAALRRAVRSWERGWAVSCEGKMSDTGRTKPPSVRYTAPLFLQSLKMGVKDKI